MQTQLNKAVKKDEVKTKGDVNQKDFILFFGEQFEALNHVKDNTGRKEFVEDMVFPTFEFPSDHAVISVDLREKGTVEEKKRSEL